MTGTGIGVSSPRFGTYPTAALSNRFELCRFGEGALFQFLRNQVFFFHFQAYQVLSGTVDFVFLPVLSLFRQVALLTLCLKLPGFRSSLLIFYDVGFTVRTAYLSSRLHTWSDLPSRLLCRKAKCTKSSEAKCTTVDATQSTSRG